MMLDEYGEVFGGIASLSDHGESPARESWALGDAGVSRTSF